MRLAGQETNQCGLAGRHMSILSQASLSLSLGSLLVSRPVESRRTAAALWCLAAVVTVTIMTSFRLAYLVWLCPFDLAPDEAHYWDWSRQLDWCYYSKGPLIAWLIRAAEELLGSWLRDTHGTSMPAVRLPAVLCGALLALGVFAFTWQTTSSPRLAYLTMLAVLLTPHFAVVSTLATIDSPFLCLWQWSLVAAFSALRLGTTASPSAPTSQFASSAPAAQHGSAFVWLTLGLLMGLGILAKPTMVLFPVCLLLFLLAHRSVRFQLRSPRIWLALAVAFLVGGLPILWWNARHDWVTFRHVFTQATLATPARWRVWGWLEYLSVQTTLLFVVGMFAWVAASLWALRLRRLSTSAAVTTVTAFLLWFCWPVFAVFLAFSWRTSIQPNWPVAAYLSAIPLVAWWLAHTWQTNRWSKALRASLAVAALLAMLVNIFLHQPRWAYDLGVLPALARATGYIQKELWPRRLDPTCRLHGWRQLAQVVQQLRETCRQTGAEPLIAATPYGAAAELAFYLPDQPRVYCLNRIHGLRFSQYDLWRPNPLADPQHFAGRPFICVGPLSEQARRGFACVQPPIEVTIYRYGYPVFREWIHLAHDFRGFPTDQQPPCY